MKRTPKPNAVSAHDFKKLVMPKSLAVSPDGKYAAFTRSWIDEKKNKYFANLHILNLQNGESRQWTFGEHTDRSPAWSQDGKRLVFFRRELGEDRIYCLSRDGGEAELLWKGRGVLAEALWACDDSALVVKFRKSDPDEEAEKAIAEGKEPESKAPACRRITRPFYRLDGVGFFPQDRFHLYKLDLKKKSMAQLTKGMADDGSFAISADSWVVAYVANTHRDPDPRPFDNDVFLLNLKSGNRKMVHGPQGDKSALSFSPDGKWLIYLGHHNKQDSWGVEPVHPWRIDLRSGKLKNLTPDYDRQPSDLSLADIGFEFEAPKVAWSKDSKYMYYQVSDRGDTVVVKTPVSGGDPAKFWSRKGQVALFDVQNNVMVCIHADFENLGDIHVCENIASPKASFRRVLAHNRDYLKSVSVAQVHEVWIPSTDKTKVHGFLYTPPKFTRGKIYPAILYVHGGPRAQYARVFFHEMQYLAACGYVVLLTNPRGSQGYGKKFAESIVAAWGTKDYEDIMSAANWLGDLRFVDTKRIGIAGGSYGGYMVNFALGNTRRFKAGVTQRSVVDLQTFAGSSDIGFYDNLEFGGYYWENPEGYKRMSPLTYAANVRDPLLIIHNENDLRCSIEQAEQLFAALKIRGRTVEFLRVPEESHGLSRGGRPDRRVIRMEAVRDWFDRYLKK
ncbi:S9 family peptidase [bacterium]|nr:S9 family peptidase [bacterium]